MKFIIAIVSLFLMANSCPNDVLPPPQPPPANDQPEQPFLSEQRVKDIADALKPKWGMIQAGLKTPGVNYFVSHNSVFELAQFPDLIFKSANPQSYGLNLAKAKTHFQDYAAKRVNDSKAAQAIVKQKGLQYIKIPQTQVIEFDFKHQKIHVVAEQKFKVPATIDAVEEHYHQLYKKFASDPALKQKVGEYFKQQIIFSCHANVWDLKGNNIPELDGIVEVDIEPGEELEKARANHGESGDAYVLALATYVLLTGESAGTIATGIPHPDFFDSIYDAASQCAKERNLPWPVNFSEYVHPVLTQRIRAKYGTKRIDEILPDLKANRLKALQDRDAFEAFLQNGGIAADPQKLVMNIPGAKSGKKLFSKKLQAVIKNMNALIQKPKPPLPLVGLRTFDFQDDTSVLTCSELLELNNWKHMWPIFDAQCEEFDINGDKVTVYRIRA